MLVFGQPRERGNDLASRPSTYPIAADAEAERTHASESFSVTWIDDPSSSDAPDLRDKDEDGVPDSVQSVLDAFESARNFLLNELRYRAPPVEGPLRIYVAARDGLAVTKPAPGGSGRSRPSFIVIPTATLKPALSPRPLRALAAHEYFHAIQNGYDAEDEHWIREATASWVEDVIDDGLNSNHDSLPAFVPEPRKSLTDVTGEYEYGAFLFIQFLVERYGNGNPGLVRELWEHMATRDALGAVEAVLAGRGVAFPRAWAEFLLWRWDLDRFQEGQAYAGVLGNQWPVPLQNTEVRNESCRLSSDQGSGLPPLSGDYAVFRPADRPGSGKATVTVEGPVGATGFALVKKIGGGKKVQLLEIGSDGLASARVRWGDDVIKRVVLGVSNPAREGAPARFGYSLKILGREAVDVEPVGPPAETHFFGGLSLRGRVLCNGQPAALADVVLVQDKRSGEQRTFPLSTAPGGTWFLTFQPEQTSTYHVEVVDPLLSNATSAPWDVAVRVALTLEVPDPDVALGEPVAVEGTITPAHAGALVQIEYRRPDLSWRSGPQTTANPDGSYGASLVLPASGIWHMRATVLGTGDQDHLGTSTIQDVFVNVR